MSSTALSVKTVRVVEVVTGLLQVVVTVLAISLARDNFNLLRGISFLYYKESKRLKWVFINRFGRTSVADALFLWFTVILLVEFFFVVGVDGETAENVSFG